MNLNMVMKYDFYLTEVNMKIGNLKCVKDVKCNNCGKVLKEDIDYRYSVIGGYSKTGLLLCEDCFLDLKRTISEMWIII